MLYIHKFYVVKNINWLCIQLNFILFNLRHRDGWKLGTIYIYKNKLSVCVWVCLSGDVMFVCRLTSCFQLTKLQTGTSGHKWRPGHRHIGNINDDTQRESDRDKRNVRLAITINKAPGHKWRPGHREYKWRPGHSKRNYRPGHRNTNDDRDKNDDRDTGNINDDRDTQREITDWDTGTQMTTRTQGI
jgi:hypothetical protein